MEIMASVVEIYLPAPIRTALCQGAVKYLPLGSDIFEADHMKLKCSNIIQFIYYVVTIITELWNTAVITQI